MNQNSIFEDLKQLIEAYVQNNGNPPRKLVIGYKTYYNLMKNVDFSNEVVSSAMDPNKRKFQKIKIKVTKDDYQLELE